MVILAVRSIMHIGLNLPCGSAALRKPHRLQQCGTLQPLAASAPTSSLANRSRSGGSSN